MKVKWENQEKGKRKMKQFRNNKERWKAENEVEKKNGFTFWLS